MFSPGADSECLDEVIGIGGILIEAPVECASAAAYSAHLLHGVNECLMVFREHTVTNCHEHGTVLRSGIHGKVALRLIKGGAKVESLYAMKAPAQGGE
jgi:hypothetical protein